jgi:hypothetical protein
MDEERSRAEATARLCFAPRGRVLIIDNEPMIGSVLQCGLRNHHDGDFALSASIALGICGWWRFDLILCDIGARNVRSYRSSAFGYRVGPSGGGKAKMAA